MMVTQLSDCDGNNMACATFMSGQFDPAPGCASSEAGDDAASSVSADGGKDYANMGSPSSSDDISCSLAPGTYTLVGYVLMCVVGPFSYVVCR
jgi:hypothetical protein